MEHAEDSLCNPTAGLGICQAEFLQRVRGPDHRTAELGKWFNIILDNNQSQRHADLACSRLFSTQWFEQFIITYGHHDEWMVPRVKTGFVFNDEVERSRVPVEGLGELLAATGF
jgi:hypothetical protein